MEVNPHFEAALHRVNEATPELMESVARTGFPQPASMLVTIRLASNTDTIFFFMLFLLYFAAFSAVKYVNIFVFLL